MNKINFISKDFKVPQYLVTDNYILRMLKVTDAVKDYEAIMSSIKHLQKTKPFGPNEKWPIGLTMEQNLIDLERHQKEFQMSESFAYTVMNKDESTCLGCIYIQPSTKIDYDAKIYLWVRESEIENGLDDNLFKSVKNWINESWPFKNVAFPGREIDWEEWDNL